MYKKERLLIYDLKLSLKSSEFKTDFKKKKSVQFSNRMLILLNEFDAFQQDFVKETTVWKRRP